MNLKYDIIFLETESSLGTYMTVLHFNIFLFNPQWTLQAKLLNRENEHISMVTYAKNYTGGRSGTSCQGLCALGHVT